MGLIADVFKAQLVKSNGDVLATTTLQDANIDVKVDEKDIRGGEGNNILYVIHSSRDISVTLTDPEFRYDFLATQLGTDIVTGTGVGYATSKFYSVSKPATDKIITLDNTPLANSLVIYDSTTKKLTTPTDYTVSGNTVTFVSAGVNVGDLVEVRSYQYNTDATTESIEINAVKFASGVKLILETAEINDKEEVIAKIQYQFDNAIPDGNIKMDTKSDRSGTTHQMALKVIKPKTSDVVGRVLRIPVVQ